MPRSLLLLVGLSAACAPQQPAQTEAKKCNDIFASESSSGTPVATVGDQVLSVEDLERKINGMAPFVRGRYQSKERRKEYIEHLMDKALLAQVALDRGLHKEEKVIDTLQTALAQELSRRVIEERTNFDAIDEAAAKTYYDEHHDDYHKPGAVRIAHIYKRFDGDKNKSKAALSAVLAEIKAGIKTDRGLFRKKVADFSDDESTKAIGGDLRYLTEPQLQERFGDGVAKAIWNLPKINTMTDVIEGKEGWHVFRMTGRRHAHSQEFKDVKEQIRHRIFRKQRRDAMKTFLEEARAKTTYKLDEAAMDSIKIAAPKPGESKPPAGVRAPMPGAHGGHGHGHPHGAAPKKLTIKPGRGVIQNGK